MLATPPARIEVAGTNPVVGRVVLDPPEVHLLCHQGDYLCAIWAVKTLLRMSAAPWRPVIHLQGPASLAMRHRLLRHLPGARLIEQREANERVQHLLPTYPRLLEARRQSPFMMKLIDLVLLADADRILIVDSDVLFFREPFELRQHLDRAAADTWLFQRDPVSQYNITESDAASAFGIRLPERINSGIAVVPRALVDFALCERLLAHDDVRRPTGWIEQTLFALCAGARGTVAYLPPSYVVSLERGLDYRSFTARHFAGPSRPLLTEEGMPYAVAQGCLG